MLFPRSTVMVAGVFVILGCAQPRPTVPGPTPPPPAPAVNPQVPPHPVNGLDPVPLEMVGSISDLVRRAQAQHPSLAAVQATYDAAKAREIAAQAWPNPDLDLHGGRSEPRSDGDDAERETVFGGSITQRLEWFSKRRSRRNAALADTAVSEARSAAALIAVEGEVRLAAIALAVAREEVQQAEADAALAGKLMLALEKGLALGDREAALVARARLEVANAQLRLDASRRTADAGVAVLRLWCGDGLPSTVPIEDALPTAPPVLDPQRLEALAAQDPRLAALQAEIGAANARRAVERTARIPDLTLGVFAERDVDEDVAGVIVGMEIPLWYRNAGGIAEAAALHRVAVAELHMHQVEQRRETTLALGEYEAARAEAETLRTTILPLAEEVMRLRSLAFDTGELPLIEMLEARRSLLLAQAATLHARRRASEAQVRLGQAIGSHDFFTTVPQETTP